MELKHYWKDLSPDGKRELAVRVGTCTNYISQMANGFKRPSHDMAKRLHSASGGKLPLWKLRPDIWSPGDQAA